MFDYIINGFVKMFKGDIVNNKTQRIAWTDDGARYTSAFVQSIILFIAREFSKLEIYHRVYTKQTDGNYLTADKLGSDIFEVLNYAPNGMLTNAEWKRELASRLMRGVNVYLKPIRKGGNLVKLEFSDKEEYLKSPDDILVITSPIFVSNNSTLYDNMLTNISRQLNNKKLKGFLKVNAAINSQNSNFREKAEEQLKLLQEVSAYNGLGVLDAKTDVQELQHEYETVPDNVIDVIKKEILNGFGISEKLLTGEYNEQDYKHFFDNVLAPIIKEIETELTYKLLSTNARVNDGVKNRFERIVISVDTFKFASVGEIINLASANTNGAFLTVNEIRKLMGYDPISGGDVYRTNLNSQEVRYGD